MSNLSDSLYMEKTMQTPTLTIEPTKFPFSELDQIERAIQASEQCLSILNNRREALFAELERITRPSLSMVIEAAKTRAQRSIGPGFEYQGTMFRHWNYIDIHVNLLRRLWTEFPDRREAMAKAIGCYGTKRSYVAKTRAELFPDLSEAWACRYSKLLMEDWYVDTNLNRERMRRILPAAVQAAGLKWGTDVRVFWRPTPINEN